MLVPTMADMMAQGQQQEALVSVGAAGSFDDRGEKITRALVKMVQQAKWEYA